MTPGQGHFWAQGYNLNKLSTGLLDDTIVVFFLPWSSKGVAYANFISELLSVVFAEYTELIWLFEMECLI